MPFLAFYRQNLAQLFGVRSNYLVEYLKDYTDSQIAKFSNFETTQLLNKCIIVLPTLKLDQIQLEKATVYTGSQQTEVKTMSDQIYKMGDNRTINNILVYKIPYEGQEAVFYLRPYPEFPGVIGIDEVSSTFVVIRFTLDPFCSVEEQIPNFSPRVRQILSSLQSVLENLGPEIEGFNLKLKLYLENEIARRQHITDKPQTIQPILKPNFTQKLPTATTKFLGNIDLS